MSFRDCLTNAHAQGMLTDDDLKKAHRMYDDIARRYARDFGPGGGAAQAAKATLDAIERAALEKKRALMLQRQALKNTAARIDAQFTVKGDADPAGGLDSLMDADDLNNSNIPAYRQHYEAILGRAHGKMAAVLETFRPTLTGARRNKAMVENVARELHGEKTGDAAASELAKAWSQTAEWLRLRFNAAGGHIGRLETWGLPHSHDSLKVRQMGRDAWVDYIAPLLDSERMLDRDTGLAFTPERLREVLGETYDQIAQQGWAKRNPQQRALGSTIASRHADARFLVFKDADSWLAYDARLGSADPYNAMVGHLDSMARDIAAMELFGPSATATLHYVEQTTLKRAAELDAKDGGNIHTDRAQAMARRMWNGWDIMRGNANRPVNGFWANALATTRTLLGAAQLGKAAIGAVSDLNYQRIAAQMNGLDAARQVSRYVGLLNPGNDADRQIALRAGLIGDNYTHLALAQKRYSDTLMGADFAQRLSHTVMTATGLSPWTQAGRWAFGMEFMGTLADNAGKTLDQLNPALRGVLERHGFSAGDWNIMRKAEIYESEGARFLRAEEIAQRDERLADRLLGMIAAEREYAVPTYSLRGNAAIYGKGVEPGTVVGELVRSPFMYKSFGITLLNTHLRRRALEFMMAPDLASKSRVAARGLDFAVSSMVMGGLVYQLKAISAGRDPAPMLNKDGSFLSPKFLGASFLQSGGIGVFSDFFFTDLNSYGRGLPETLAGPVGAFAGDTINLTLGNALQAAGGQDPKIAQDAINYVRRYTPGGNIWYSQLAVSRLFYDRLSLWADPRARANMRRIEGKYRSEFGQGLWWRGGQLAPDRAPDISNSLTEARQ